MEQPRSRMCGLFAALITPVDENGRPDPEGIRRLLDFVLESGVDGVCLGGGTAEYPHFSLDERKSIIETGARHLGGQAPFLAAVGAPTFRGVLELGRHARDLGSSRLLLPMPYFFHYEQTDLEAYVADVVDALDTPCLLYNLAAFTNPLEPKTALKLLRSEHNVVGLKDSSGNRSALKQLADERGHGDTLLCGSDGVLLEALEAGWDGGVSGVASCAPEILVGVYQAYRGGDMEAARHRMAKLKELVDLVDRLPFPWSIRVACEVRGIPNGPLPWPTSSKRKTEIERLREEYDQWFEANLRSAAFGDSTSRKRATSKLPRSAKS